jgi:hypothetical protein
MRKITIMVVSLLVGTALVQTDALARGGGGGTGGFGGQTGGAGIMAGFGRHMGESAGDVGGFGGAKGRLGARIMAGFGDDGSGRLAAWAWLVGLAARNCQGWAAMTPFDGSAG